MARCRSLPCSHTLHEQCMRQFLKHGLPDTCPVCRRSCPDLTPVEERYIRAIENLARGKGVNIVEECNDILAIDPEHTEAAALLGQNLVQGTGTEKDITRGIDFLTMAAQRGSAQAATVLGDFYIHGSEGLPQDVKKGVELLKQGVETANAQVSEALLRSNCGEQNVNHGREHGVVVLEYTRCPDIVWRTLAESPALADIRDALGSAGHSWNTSSGAKMFVGPEKVGLVLDELKAQKWELKPWHVVVEADKEDLVRTVLEKAVKTVPKKERGMCKVKRRHVLALHDLALHDDRSSPNVLSEKSTAWMPASFFVHYCRERDCTHAAHSLPVRPPMLVKRTFIHVKVPTSLHDGSSSKPATL